MSREPDLAKRELWKRRLVEFERGTATVVDFCDRVGVSVATFYQWRRKLAKLGARSAGEPQRPAAAREAAAGLKFLPVELIGRRSVEVLLPGGTRVLVPSDDQEALRTILAAVAGPRREEASC